MRRITPGNTRGFLPGITQGFIRGITRGITSGTTLLVGLLACVPGFEREEAAPPAWTPVLVTQDLTISIDTAGAARFKSNAFVLRVRTDHRTPRNYEGQPWDREVTGVVLRCDVLMTKTYHVRLSLGDEEPIVFQLERERDVIVEQPWRVVEPRSDEETAARVACAMLEYKPVDPRRDGQLRLRL